MNDLQNLVVIVYGMISLIIFIKGIHQTKVKKNPFGLTPFGIFGVFVWGDAVIIGLFWLLASIFAVYVNDWKITLLIVSIFWVVRSFGEVIYWLLEQFASKKRDKPETVPWHSFFPGESVWFAQQVWWQMVLVVSILSTIVLINSGV